MEKVVYIPMEAELRELTAKTLLCTELAHRGYRAVMGQHDMVRSDFAAKEVPGVFIDKDYKEAAVADWKKVKANGCAVYALDEEAVVYETPDIYRDMRVSKNAIDLATGIFMWGPDQKEIIKVTSPDIEKKGHIVSNPRMDLLAENTKIFYGDQSAEYRKKYGPYILINSHHGYARSKNFYMHAVGSVSDETMEYIETQEVYRRRNLEEFIKGVRILAEKWGKSVIIRPHPNENGCKKEFIEGFKDMPNVHVILTGDSNAWIDGAEIMVHSGCSTAFEAYESGKVSILFQPLYEEAFDRPFPNRLSDLARTPEELCSLVFDYLEGRKSREDFFTPEKEQLIRSRIIRDKNRLSVQMMADVLDGNSYDETYTKIPVKKTLKNRIKIVVRAIQRKRSKGMTKKYAYISPSRIRKLVEKSQKALGTNDRIRVRELQYNIFEFEKK